MRNSVKTWINFGAISGVITTLWLMIWLAFGSESKIIVIWWILTIAVADALSDALWIHISEESKKQKSKDIWISTITTFFAKFIFAISFIIPLLFLSLHHAIFVSMIRWFLIVIFISYKIACSRKENPWHAIFEHLLIMILVIIVTYFIWIFVSKKFVV